MTLDRIFIRVLLSGLFVLPFGQVLAKPVAGQVTSVNMSPLQGLSCKDRKVLPGMLTAADVIGKNVVWLASKNLYQVTTDHGDVCLKRIMLETNIPPVGSERGHCVAMGSSDTTSASSNGLSGACN